MKSSLLGLLLVSSFGSALSAQTPKLSYDEHVAPILRERCFSCHNPDKKKGGLVLNTYGSMMAGGSSGAIVTPGDPDSSRFFLLVSHQEEPYMPPRSERLPQKELDVFRRWLAQGALENAKSKATIKKPRKNLAFKASPGNRPAGEPAMPRGVALTPEVVAPRAGALIALSASPWAPLFALGGQRQILLYHAVSLELIGILPFPEGRPQVLKFSRNGSLLIAGGGRAGKSGMVVVWDVVSGKRVTEVGDEYDTVLAADISADHSQVVLGGPSKMVRVFSTSDGELLYEIKKHTDWVTGVEFSPDAVLLATADRNGGLHVWEAHTGREYLTLGGHGGRVTGVSWRGDSNVLASASEDRSVRLWEMDRGRQIKRWNAHGGGTLSVFFASNGQLVTSGRDRRVRLWNGDGKEIRKFDEFGDLALRAALLHDGSRVVAGDWSGEIRVWNAADGQLAGKLDGNPLSVDVRLAAAAKELESLKSHEAQLRAESATKSKLEAELRTKLDLNRRELALAQETLKKAAQTLQVGKGGVRKEVGELVVLVKRLQDKAKILEANAGQVKLSGEEKKAFEVTQTSAKEKIVKATRELDAWIAAQKASLGAHEKAVEARQEIGKLEPRLKRIAAEAKTTKDEYEKVRPLLDRANRLFAKWSHAKHLETAIAELRAKQEMHDKALNVESGLSEQLKQAKAAVLEAQKRALSAESKLKEHGRSVEQAKKQVIDSEQGVESLRSELDKAQRTVAPK